MINIPTPVHSSDRALCCTEIRALFVVSMTKWNKLPTSPVGAGEGGREEIKSVCQFKDTLQIEFFGVLLPAICLFITYVATIAFSHIVS